MEPLDLVTEIERFISINGISHDDSVERLINALLETEGL
jgi:hypothetical protein